MTPVLRPSSLDRVGAIVLTYGSCPRHVELVESILTSGIRPDDVVVVHNPSTPGEVGVEVASGVTRIVMDRNRGYAAAMNRGLSHLRARGLDLAFLFTHDVRVGSGALEDVAALLRRLPRHGSCRRFSILWSDGQKSLGGRSFANGVRHISEPQDGGLVQSADWVDGSALLLRLSALPKSEPLPSRYFMYYEDVWLGHQLRRAGWMVAGMSSPHARSEKGNEKRPGAFEYLTARNGVHYVRTFFGLRGAVAFSYEELRVAWTELPKPGGVRFRNATMRHAQLIKGGARLLGLAHGLLGVWGAPPRLLRRHGDIAGT